MFTGIIEEIGSIRQVAGGSIIVGASKVMEDIHIGDSIAVNGVCLTAAEIGTAFFKADVMAETLRRSNLGQLRQGSKVNLERAMAADGRFGGHIVSGHIDGTGTILGKRREANAVWITVGCGEKLLRYIVEKGSIAIDGISLTVAAVEEDNFKVSLIPHTGEETTLLSKEPGDALNLENDIIAKYIEKLMKPKEPKEDKIDMDFLQKAGF